MAEPNINLFHIVAVAPAIGYLGYLGYTEKSVTFNKTISIGLIILAIIILLYHAYRYYTKVYKKTTETMDIKIVDTYRPDEEEIDDTVPDYLRHNDTDLDNIENDYSTEIYS